MIVNMSGGATAKVWKQERLIAHLASMTDDVKLWTNIEGSAANPIATYTPDANGDLWVDLTDYVRTYPSVTAFNFSFGVGSNWPLVVTIEGLINPENVLIPYQPLLPEKGYVIPPSRLLIEEASGSIVECEFYTTTPSLFTIFGASFADDTKRQVVDVETDGFAITCPRARKAYQPKLIQCGVEYAFVRWVSFTGMERLHIFEVSKSKLSTKDAYSLLPIDNDYIDIKGREDSFILGLSGLAAYDVWYYSDVITSSKVELSFDGTTWSRVQVDSKSITIPDGEASDGKLEINVNWKKYDAVAL